MANRSLSTGRPFHQWFALDGSLWATFNHLQDRYLIEFPTLARFTISSDGLVITPHPEPGVSPQTVEHLYFNQVLPLALSRQYKLVLHGGAVVVEDEAIAFLGRSGQGKSTLTASLATRGFPFLTDDGLQLELEGYRYLAQPSHPSIRLWDDSRERVLPSSALAPPLDYTPKARLLAGGDVSHCNEPRPLKTIYFLGEGDCGDIRITPHGSRDAIIELVRHSFLLDIDEREMLSHHFGQLTDLVKAVPCFHLDYPRDYALLPRVREAIIRHAASLSAAS